MAQHTPAPTSGRAVYGFALYFLFNTLFIIYVIWAFIPRNILEEKLGLIYLLDQYFALYIPIVILCAVTIFAFFIYPSTNLAMTPDIDDISSSRDVFAIYKCNHVDSKGRRCTNNVSVSLDQNWSASTRCSVHRSRADEVCTDNTEISNFCDCPEGGACFFRERPKYLNVINARAKVPVVSDIDLADVCNSIFES